MGYARGSFDGNMMGMRSGTFPKSENGCTNNPDMSSFAVDDGRGGTVDGVLRCFTFNVSGGLTVSVASSDVGTGRVSVFFGGILSSKFFGELLLSFVDDRDDEWAESVLSRGRERSAGDSCVLAFCGLLDGAGRLRFVGAVELCRFFSISGRFLKMLWASVSFADTVGVLVHVQ